MPAPEPVSVRVPSRLGLLGNPGDVYDGRALALAIWNFSAEVHLSPAVELELPEDPGAAALLRAALGRLPEAPHNRVALRASSDIPRQVGLAGSSAIVVAALQALARFFGIDLQPADVAERALAAERDDLGFTAGPMDRVVQAYGGLVWMDFRPPRSARRYQRLDASLLPPLFVAWNPEPGEASGVAHDDVRVRWERGDAEVRQVMAELPAVAERGVAALESGDREGFMECMDRNFDLRARIWPLRERDVELVRVGRARGAAVKYCGSGGAVVGAFREEGRRAEIEKAYDQAGFLCAAPVLQR
jgi:glucuronokinase